jgi:phage tail sheath gpL-like
MAVDASAVARVLGIEPTYQDLRGGNILYLPQRIAVIAQGATASSYSTTKFTATSAAVVGATVGYGSPAHLVAKELFPINGDGVGTVPVDFFLLAQHASGVAAAGSITPSGSQTTAGSYRVVVNNKRSEAFTIPVASSVTTVCRLIRAAIDAVLEMPVVATNTYGTVTAAAGTNTGNGTCTVLSATGSPVAGGWTLVCNTAVANGGVWTLTDPNGTVISTTVTMTPGVGGATVIAEGGIQFTLTDGTTDFAAADSFAITVPATNVVLTSKWKGATANDLVVEVDGEDLGTTFTIVQPLNGLTNPTVDAALAQFGNVWYTLVINALGIDDATALNTIQTAGEGRWGALVRKPFMAFVGNTATSVASATSVSTLRRTDRINGQLVEPASNDLPFVVAARQVARIAKIANNNPPHDYAGQRATGLTPGADGSQWDYAMRDAAVKAGSSTIEVVDGVVRMSDTVLFYRPTGEEPPAYRFVVDVIKVWNILYNIDLIFAADGWIGKPLIPDDQVVTNADARKPKHAKAALASMTDSLALNAIISDPKFAKSTIAAAIDAGNPNRLNVSETFKISGHTGIVDVALNWGFFFGTAAVAA